MAVFRVEKNSGYTVMSNHHLRNRALSLKAKGLLSQMLSLPEDWDYTLQGLARINRESIDAIRQAIRELEQAGYIQRSRERDEKGRLRGADYVIFELPQPIPASVSPTLENPTLENASIHVQLSFLNRKVDPVQYAKSFEIAPQGDDFDDIRAEYTAILQKQLASGNNGIVKTKYLTFTIEADSPKTARARLTRIGLDLLGYFKTMGCVAHVMDGQERLEVLHGIFHPDGEPFRFDWDWLAPSGLSTKDFVAPSSLCFGTAKTFGLGGKYGAVSFLQILAPELSDEMLADFLKTESGILVNLHVQAIDQTEAIKTIKRKIKMLREAARSDQPEDKLLLWLSRPSGTFCFRERDVLLKDTQAYNTWKFCGEQICDRILAYAVELTGAANGTVQGNLYELDYQQHFQHIRDAALPVGANRLIYESGMREIGPKEHFDSRPDKYFGEFVRYEMQPRDPELLQAAIRQEQRSRESAQPGDFKEHLAALHTGLIEAEAQRIVADMKRLAAPNSPDKNHFMVEVSPYFTKLASSRDTDQLLAMLPYKSLHLSSVKDRFGIYALIDKNENRDKGIDNGQIAQQGTHEELLKQPGIYQEFVNIRKNAAGWSLA